MADALALLAGVVVGAFVAWFIASRRCAHALDAALHTPLFTTEAQPAEQHRSPAMYLHACSRRLGVSTQTLKDLGFEAVETGGHYSLKAPTVPKRLEELARGAMLEIAAESRKGQIPATSWRWIALAAEKWRKTR